MTAPVGHRRPRRPPGRSAVAHRARAGERGAVLIVVVISMTMIVTCTALTIDLGRVSMLRRDLQNVADVVALDLSRLLDGTTPAGDLLAEAAWASAREATLDRNGFVEGGPRSVEVALGTYDAAADVFEVYAVEGGPHPSPGSVPRSVRVRAFDRVDYAFAPGGSDTSRHAVATASSPVAGFRVGSYAARLDTTESSLLGPLSSALGAEVGMDLVGYQGLARTDVELGLLLSELGLTLLDPDQVLATDVSLAELALAQASALEHEAGGSIPPGLASQVALLESLALEVRDVEVGLGDLLGLGTGDLGAAATTRVNVLDMILAGAFLATAEHGLELPLDLGIPGVLDGGANLSVVEGPRTAFGPVGTSAETAQVRLTTGLDLTGLGLVGARLELSLDVAASEATFVGASCGTPEQMFVDVSTGLVDLGLEVSAGIQVRVPLVGNLHVADAVVTATSGQAAGASDVGITFTLPDDLGRAVQVDLGTLDLGGLALHTDVDLLPGLGLDAVLGLVTGLVDGVVADVLSPLVATVLATLDATLVQPLLHLLGISAPGADVAPLALECGGRKLVA